MRRAGLAVAVAVVSLGCRDRAAPVPERTTTGTSLNLGATPTTPEVHINPAGDGGATAVQIGNARVQLPGENDRADQAEREAR